VLTFERTLQLERVEIAATIGQDARALGVESARLVFESQDELGARVSRAVSVMEPSSSLVIPRGRYSVTLEDVRWTSGVVLGSVDVVPGGLVVDGPELLDVEIPAPLEISLEVNMRVGSQVAEATLFELVPLGGDEDADALRVPPSGALAYPGDFNVRVDASSALSRDVVLGGLPNFTWSLTPQTAAFTLSFDARRVRVVPTNLGVEVSGAAPERQVSISSVSVDRRTVWSLSGDTSELWAVTDVVEASVEWGHELFSTSTGVSLPVNGRGELRVELSDLHGERVRLGGRVDASMATMGSAEPSKIWLTPVSGRARDFVSVELSRLDGSSELGFELYVSPVDYVVDIELLSRGPRTQAAMVRLPEVLSVRGDSEVELVVPEYGRETVGAAKSIRGAITLAGERFPSSAGPLTMQWSCVARCGSGGPAPRADLVQSAAGLEYEVRVPSGVYEVTVSLDVVRWRAQGGVEPLRASYTLHPRLRIADPAEASRRSFDIKLVEVEVALELDAWSFGSGLLDLWSDGQDLHMTSASALREWEDGDEETTESFSVPPGYYVLWLARSPEVLTLSRRLEVSEQTRVEFAVPAVRAEGEVRVELGEGLTEDGDAWTLDFIPRGTSPELSQASDRRFVGPPLRSFSLPASGGAFSQRLAPVPWDVFHVGPESQVLIGRICTEAP